MDEKPSKNIVSIADIRRRKTSQTTCARKGANGRANSGKPPPQASKESLKTQILRWVQFLFLLSLTAYMMQQCGML